MVQTHSDPTTVIGQLQRAINQHDLAAMGQCFAPNYRSEFPAHPERAFRGHEQMRRNWSHIFRAVPDIEAAVVSCAVDGETVWTEWEWRGTGPAGKPHIMRGVTVQGVQEDRIAWVRLYMEPVQTDGPAEAIGAGAGS